MSNLNTSFSSHEADILACNICSSILYDKSVLIGFSPIQKRRSILSLDAYYKKFRSLTIIAMAF